MTHFLQWCCPEFAEEVLDVFQRYLSGDASLVAQSAALRAATLETELKASEDDKLRQQELMEQHVANYDKVIATLTSAKEEIAARHSKLTEELERLRREDAEKYDEAVRYHAAKEAELLSEVESLQDIREDLDEKKRKLEDQMENDTGRPLNVFKKARVDVASVNRDNTFNFWFPARHITIDACIYFARKNYVYYAELVTAATVNDCFFADKAIAACLTQLSSDSRPVVKSERKLIRAKFHELPTQVVDAITLKIARRVQDQLMEVFGVCVYNSDVDIFVAINNVKLYQLLCKKLKKIYAVEYSTQIDAKYLAKMALNFNRHAMGEFKIPLDSDYDEFDEETLEDVHLYEF